MVKQWGNRCHEDPAWALFLGYTALPCTQLPRSTLSEATTTDAAALRKRLYWHSRRGMWELDLLLIPFLEHCYDQLEADDQAAYRAMITGEDQDMFAWLMQREAPPPEFARIVSLIQQHAGNADNDPRRPV